MNNDLHIVLASDSNYAKPLTVAMCSAATNCNITRRIVFHVMQQGIEGELRNKIQASVKSARADVQINWLDVPFEKLSAFKISHTYLSPMIYARLLVQWIISPEIERVLYLDSD